MLSANGGEIQARSINYSDKTQVATSIKHPTQSSHSDPQSPRQRMAGLKTLPRDDNSGFLVKVATRVNI